MTISVVVDDRPIVRDGFCAILEAQPDIDVVGVAGDGQVAIDQVGSLQPDVVVMDIRMPVTDGIEATRRITSRHPATARRP